MIKEVVLNNQKISYQIRKSKKAKRMRLAVYCDGSVVITQPRNINFINIENFLKLKASWLLKKIDFFNNSKSSLPKRSRKDYLENKEKVLSLVNIKIAELNKIYNFEFNKISIRNQKTRWGSCSRKKNLNFNYRMMYLPEKVIDYIIVHELCHLKEFNHSKNFWNLVQIAIPDYKNIKKLSK